MNEYERERVCISVCVSACMHVCYVFCAVNTNNKSLRGNNYGPTTNMSMHKYIICVVVVSVFFYISFFNVPN